MQEEKRGKDRKSEDEPKKGKWSDKTSAGFAHLCQAERERPAVRGRGREREIERWWAKRKEGGGDGGTPPTSTSARNCFGGGITMKAGAG